WHFKEKNNITEVSFEVDFELKNEFLNIVMTKSFQFALDKIADAFEKREQKAFPGTLFQICCEAGNRGIQNAL
ncbi:MAG: hypothetical protein QF645_12330, partial [Planctomycetota bacterium]|nr:hypothetical protein [Planctomycetota bacterium]